MKAELCIIPPEEWGNGYLHCTDSGCNGGIVIKKREFCAELTVSVPLIGQKALKDFIGALGDYMAEQIDQAKSEILRVISDYVGRGDLWGPGRMNSQGIYINVTPYGFMTCSYLLELDKNRKYPSFHGTTLKVALQEMLDAHRAYEQKCERDRKFFASEESTLAVIRSAQSLDEVKRLISLQEAYKKKAR